MKKLQHIIIAALVTLAISLAVAIRAVNWTHNYNSSANVLSISGTCSANVVGIYLNDGNGKTVFSSEANCVSGNFAYSTDLDNANVPDATYTLVLGEGKLTQDNSHTESIVISHPVITPDAGSSPIVSAPAWSRFTSPVINGKTTGTTKIVTTDSSLGQFHPLMVVYEMVSGSSVITPATVSIGTNASSYTNIVAASAMTGMSSAKHMQLNVLSVITSSVDPSTDVFANVSVGAVGTAFTFKVTVIGYYD